MYATISADMENLDIILDALAGLLVAASKDADIKKNLRNSGI
ncbi:hypothetical protein [Corynebacterium glucuronolyticum]|nr:hypothetical protein [Corynebacterium glucuronolyticum]